LAAQSAQLSLALERNRAWVALYRALGGGFDATAPNDATASR
jgi:outer membrane protein TolC